MVNSIQTGPTHPESSNILVRADELRLWYPINEGSVLPRRIGWVRAVDGIDLRINRGETLALVGESGSGKSSAGRALLQVHRPTGGRVYLDGTELTGLRGSSLRRLRRQMQLIYQDPYSSLNPRMTVEKIVGEPLEIHRIGTPRDRVDRVGELLLLVGLAPTYGNRYPHEFSGGQRQRIAIARALALNPAFIVCDEPISALDVSIQAQIINLFEDLQQQFGLTYLFIAHDLAVVRHIASRVAVMYVGKILESASRETLFEQPLHPYTRALLSAVPSPDPVIERKRARIILGGDIPSPANPPAGCRFHPRCPTATDYCREVEPQLTEVREDHWVACHYWDEVADQPSPVNVSAVT